MQNPQNPKDRHIEFRRAQLLKELERLASQVDNPGLTQEQFEEIREKVRACQAKFEELKRIA